MPFQPPGYEMERALIEHRRQRRIDKRRARKASIAASKKPKLKHVPSSALRSELTKRRLARTPKERQKAWAEKSAAVRAIRKQFCDHKKHPPKLRASGKNAGFYACVSCNERVPAPRPGEDLVT